MAKKSTRKKPQSAAVPQDDGFGTVDAAILLAQAFLTRKVIRRLQDIGTASQRDDWEVAVIEAGADLSEELRLADPEEWRRETGRDLPRNVEELRGIMEECGYSPDFISNGNWTPREVGPVLLRRLRDAGWSEPMSKAAIGDKFERTPKQIDRWVESGKIELRERGVLFQYRLPGG